MAKTINNGAGPHNNRTPLFSAYDTREVGCAAGRPTCLSTQQPPPNPPGHTPGLSHTPSRLVVHAGLCCSKLALGGQTADNVFFPVNNEATKMENKKTNGVGDDQKHRANLKMGYEFLLKCINHMGTCNDENCETYYLTQEFCRDKGISCDWKDYPELNKDYDEPTPSN